MTSSPGGKWRVASASAEMSTRFWITSRPGALRSWRCRSMRRTPGMSGGGGVIGFLSFWSAASFILVLLSPDLSEPDPGGEAVGAADEFDVPGELTGDPEAGAAAGAGGEEARRR